MSFTEAIYTVRFAEPFFSCMDQLMKKKTDGQKLYQFLFNEIENSPSVPPLKSQLSILSELTVLVDWFIGLMKLSRHINKSNESQLEHSAQIDMVLGLISVQLNGGIELSKVVIQKAPERSVVDYFCKLEVDYQTMKNILAECYDE